MSFTTPNRPIPPPAHQKSKLPKGYGATMTTGSGFLMPILIFNFDCASLPIPVRLAIQVEKLLSLHLVLSSVGPLYLPILGSLSASVSTVYLRWEVRGCRGHSVLHLMVQSLMTYFFSSTISIWARDREIESTSSDYNWFLAYPNTATKNAAESIIEW